MAYMTDDSKVPAKGKGAKLSPKMLSFVNEYFVDLNGSEAVLRAGYKTKNPNRIAAELLLHPLVKAEIEQRMKKQEKKAEIRAEYLINKLVRIIEATEEDNPQAALRAIELAGKSIALWKERQEISGPDGGAIEMEQRVKEDVADFKGRIASIATRQGKGGVSSFPKPGSTSEA